MSKLQSMQNTPAVLLIAFNRPEETEAVFEVIRQAAPPKLYFAVDGPRNNDDIDKCDRVKSLVSRVDWSCLVQTRFNTTNMGCRDGVSSAISWFFTAEEEGIILEDDCLPHPSFFPYCAELLAKYRNDERIGHIGGANLQLGNVRGNASYYFSRLTHVWGWAGWRRVWQGYNADMPTLAGFTANILANSPSHEPFAAKWMENLQQTRNGNINTWDYQYAYLNLINNRLSVIPNRNLITNIGFGPGATHTTGHHPFGNIPGEDIGDLVHPIFLIANTEADIFTQRLENPEVKKKGPLSRFWKSVRQTVSIRKDQVKER
ncbi:hypothetical protein [Pedobacter sp. SYP-B3415]|uniref:hypothetical protein n=1 Tax=Pedobacter sp. SYP-B3415 TaxID=2496641 RepID=UPI0013EBB053|nr:hypothetical protein [Pedobacter sp. SYP-B3415]